MSQPFSATLRIAVLFGKVGPALLSVGTLVLAWELYARLSGISPTTLPAPSRVPAQAIQQREALFDNTLPTIQRHVARLRLLAGRAFIFSVLIDFSRPLRRALFPLFIISQTLPLVAIAPLIVLWFGFGLTPKIMLVALVTFFPDAGRAGAGLRIDRRTSRALLPSMGASRMRIFRLARLPSSLPYFFAGPAHLDHLCRCRRHLRRICRRRAAGSASTCSTPRTISAPIWCWRPSWSAPR